MHVFSPLRLCPLGKSGKRALTEKCFQRLPLRFLTNKTWIRTLHRSGKVSRCLEKKRIWMPSKTAHTRWRTVKAHRTSLKTFPPGSQWTKVAEPNKGMRTATSNLSKVAVIFVCLLVCYFAYSLLVFYKFVAFVWATVERLCFSFALANLNILWLVVSIKYCNW